jgi:metacaspase-1
MMAMGYSLNIGVNSLDPAYYGNDGRLDTCENDALGLQELARKEGYRTSVYLGTRTATYQRVVDELCRAAEALRAGDLFMLTFSGHGERVRDENGDEENGYDESWCLYDRRILDDELHHLFKMFRPGVRVIALSDSCESGTVVDECCREYASEERCDEINASIILISACQDNQGARSGLIYKDIRYGWFTKKVLSVWNEGRFRGSYRTFHQSVVRELEERAAPREAQRPNYLVIGKENPAFEEQQPFKI